MNAWRNVCVILAALLMSGGAGAENKEKKPTVAAKEVFHVYGGSCRRSWRQLGMYQTIEEAFRAADGFRKAPEPRQVEVTLNTGEVYPLAGQPTTYRVYRNPCKGFFLADTVASAKKAEEIAASFRKNGDLVEIVAVFAKQ